MRYKKFSLHGGLYYLALVADSEYNQTAFPLVVHAIKILKGRNTEEENHKSTSTEIDEAQKLPKEQSFAHMAVSTYAAQKLASKYGRDPASLASAMTTSTAVSGHTPFVASPFNPSSEVLIASDVDDTITCPAARGTFDIKAKIAGVDRCPGMHHKQMYRGVAAFYFFLGNYRTPEDGKTTFVYHYPNIQIISANPRGSLSKYKSDFVDAFESIGAACSGSRRPSVGYAGTPTFRVNNVIGTPL